MSATPRHDRSARREALALLALALLCALFFREALALRGVFFHYDHAIQNYPYRAFFAEGLRQGRLRLWTPELFCGFPLFAESQGNALYPPFIVLFGLLEPWVAYNLYTVLHFALAGAFAYLLARVMGVSRAGSVLAGVIYMFAAPVLFHAHHTNIIVGVCYLPLLLALIELAVRRRSVPALLGFAAATGMLTLGAQPQYTLYCALVCGAFLLWRLRLAQRASGQGSAIVLLVALGAAGALGAALAAGQLLPLLELVGHTTRAGSAAALPGLSPGTPGHLVTLMLPHYFGSPGLGSFWGHADTGIYAETTLFLGVAPLMLAAFGALTDRRRRALFFAGLGLFSLLFSLGLPGAFYNAFAFLPIFRTARFPSRFAFVTALCAAVLAGMGLDRLLDEGGTRRARRRASLAAASVALLAVLALAIAAGKHAPLRGMDPAALAGRLGLRPAELAPVVLHLKRTLPADAARLALATLAGAALLLGPARLLGRGAAAKPVVTTLAGLWVALAFGELALAGREFNPVTDPAIYAEPPPLARALRELPPGRIFRYRLYDRWHPGAPAGLFPMSRGWDLEPARFAQSLDWLPHNANMLWGIASAEGFCPLQTRALKALLGQPEATSTLIQFDLQPALDLLGARYVLTPRADLPEPYRMLLSVGGLNVFENPRALPRAFIVHHGRRPPDEAAAVAMLRSEGFDYRGLVLVHDEPHPPLQLGPGRPDPDETAHLLADTGEEIAVEAHLTRPGYLVLADQHYPGWEARIDGEPARLLRLDYLLKGVRLPAGRHTVQFLFRPRSVRHGLVLTIGAAAVLLALALGAALRSKRLPLGPRPGGPSQLDLGYSRHAVRLIVGTFVLFLILGPLLMPSRWRRLPAELDPRNYVVRHAIATAYYAAIDGQEAEVYRALRDVCRWWPGNDRAWRLLPDAAEHLVRRHLEAGQRAEAEALAAEFARMAPPWVARHAPALMDMARRARAQRRTGGPSP